MALAFDAASNSAAQASVSTYSWSHTTTGSNLILIVGVSAQGGTDANRAVSGITYATVALTKIRSDADDPNNIRSELWFLVGPATGANTVEVTHVGTVDNVVAGAVSMTGAAQTGQPDAQNGGIGSDIKPTTTVTTVADNSAIMAVVITEAGDPANVASNNIERWEVDLGLRIGAGSTWVGNLGEFTKTPPGAVVMSWDTSNDPWAISAASFAPAAAGLSIPVAMSHYRRMSESGA